MTAPFWSEIKSSRLTAAGIVVIVIGAYVARQQIWPGLFIWQNRTSAWISSVTIVVPLVAALAAWDGTRIRSADLRWQWRRSTDGGLRAVMLLLSVDVATAVLIYAVIGAITHLPIAVAGVPEATPMWAWTISGAAAVALAAAVGLLIGLAVPFFFVVILTPFVLYAGCATAFLQGARRSTAMSMLSPSFQQIIEPFYGVNTGLFVHQGLWFLALLVTTAALCLVVVVRDRRWPLCVAVAAAVAGGISGGSLAARSDQPSILLQSQPFVCAGESPVICLTADYEPSRAALREALSRVAHRVSQTPLFFEKVELRPRGILGEPGPDAVAFHMDNQTEGWQTRDSLELFQELLDAQNPRGVCGALPKSDSGPQLPGAKDVVLAWASGDDGLLGGQHDLEQQLEQFSALSVPARSEFLSTNLGQICSESLSVSDLP